MTAWYLQPRARQIARNQARLDEFVIPFDELHHEAESRRGRALLFTHIPKTGGTTLEYIASKNHTINGTIQINSPALHRNPNALFKSGSFPKVVLGHHALNQVLYHFLNRHVAHVTIIREPIARIVSHYNYVKTGRHHALHQGVKDLSLEQYVQSKLSIELDNAQTFRLSGDLRRTPGRTGRDPQGALDRAKATLESRLSFFGLTDRYVEFLLMCRALLAWDDIYAVRRNVSDKAVPAESITEAAVEAMTERNRLDLALYEHAQILFNERCRLLGIGDTDIADYHSDNATYGKLVSKSHLARLP